MFRFLGGWASRLDGTRSNVTAAWCAKASRHSSATGEPAELAEAARPAEGHRGAAVDRILVAVAFCGTHLLTYLPSYLHTYRHTCTQTWRCRGGRASGDGDGLVGRRWGGRRVRMGWQAVGGVVGAYVLTRNRYVGGVGGRIGKRSGRRGVCVVCE